VPVERTLIMGKLSRDQAEQYFLDYTNLSFKIVNKAKLSLEFHDLEDFEQVGFLGLWKACITYDPDKGARFSTYASTCIKNQLKKLLRSRTGTTRIRGYLSLDQLIAEGRDFEG